MAIPEEWTLYKFRLERYLRSPAVKKLNNQSKIDIMLATMGKTADSIYLMYRDKFTATTTVEEVLEEFDAYIRPKVNVIALRAKFGRRKQHKGEPIECFLRDLWLLAEPCEFPDKEDRIRDQLILGLVNTELSMTLQNDPKMTLDKAVAKSRTYEELRAEQANQERARGTRNSFERADMDAVNRKWKVEEACPRCGNTPSHSISSCPAKDAECYQCGRHGHWAKFCRSKPKEECRSCRHGNKKSDVSHDKTVGTVLVAEPGDETFSEEEIYFVT